MNSFIGPSGSDDSDDSLPLSELAAGKRSSPMPRDEPKAKKKRAHKNDEPRKPLSAYAMFFSDTQPAIKIANPMASFGEVSKIVASMWDSLDSDSRKVYKTKTELAKKDYLKKMTNYKVSLLIQENQIDMSNKGQGAVSRTTRPSDLTDKYRNMVSILKPEMSKDESPTSETSSSSVTSAKVSNEGEDHTEIQDQVNLVDHSTRGVMSSCNIVAPPIGDEEKSIDDHSFPVTSTSSQVAKLETSSVSFIQAQSSNMGQAEGNAAVFQDASQTCLQDGISRQILSGVMSGAPLSGVMSGAKGKVIIRKIAPTDLSNSTIQFGQKIIKTKDGGGVTIVSHNMPASATLSPSLSVSHPVSSSYQKQDHLDTSLSSASSVSSPVSVNVSNVNMHTTTLTANPNSANMVITTSWANNTNQTHSQAPVQSQSSALTKTVVRNIDGTLKTVRMTQIPIKLPKSGQSQIILRMAPSGGKPQIITLRPSKTVAGTNQHVVAIDNKEVRKAVDLDPEVGSRISRSISPATAITPNTSVAVTPNTSSTTQPSQESQVNTEVPALATPLTPPTKCTRDGCENESMESPKWDRQYCSSECVVKHCRDVFMAWVASRQQMAV